MRAAFLKIRWKQLLRELASLGWWRAGIVLVVTGAALAAFYHWTRSASAALYANLFLGGAVLLVHLARRDKRFIQTAAGSLRQICLVEYLVFTAPFLVIGLGSAFWYETAALPFFYAAISGIGYTTGTKTMFLRRLPFVAAANFEWKAGMRLYFFAIFFLYVACLGFLGYAYVSLYLWWLLLALIIPFYQVCEPLDLLRAWELAPAPFLWRKLRVQLGTYGAFSTPFFVAYGLFHPAQAWIALLVWGLSAVNVAWFALAKYAAYEPAAPAQGGGVLATLVHLAMLIPMAGPFMALVPLVMVLRAFRRSLSHLKSYLHAYR